MLDNSNIKLITPNEIDSVMEIINDAKELLKQNSLQWQQGYPNKDTMLKDINSSHLYGYYIENYLVGVVALIPGIDENYLIIEEGSWINYPSEKDLTIHRIAIRNEYHNKKIGVSLLQYAIKYAHQHQYTSIKIDTHKNNIPMQIISLQTGFSYRGIIYLLRDEVDNSRLAYELSIN